MWAESLQETFFNLLILAVVIAGSEFISSGSGAFAGIVFLVCSRFFVVKNHLEIVAGLIYNRKETLDNLDKAIKEHKL